MKCKIWQCPKIKKPMSSSTNPLQSLAFFLMTLKDTPTLLQSYYHHKTNRRRKRESKKIESRKQGNWRKCWGKGSTLIAYACLATTTRKMLIAPSKTTSLLRASSEMLLMRQSKMICGDKFWGAQLI